MRESLPLAVEPNLMLRGFRYHDGAIRRIAFEDDDVAIRIESADRQQVTDFMLMGVRAYRQTGLPSESIVGWIFVVKPGDLTAEQAETLLGRDIDLYESLAPGELIVQIEAVTGVDITVLCRDIDAFPAE